MNQTLPPKASTGAEKHIRRHEPYGERQAGWFFRMVYGTAVPRYKFEYTLPRMPMGNGGEEV